MRYTQSLFVLLLLLLLWRWTKSSTCPTSIPSPINTTTQLDSFSDFSSASTSNVKEGPVSKALYYSYSVPSSVAFVKVNLDGSQAWSKSGSFSIAMKSLAVDKLEQNVYFIASIGTMVVGRLRSSDGTVEDAQGL